MSYWRPIIGQHGALQTSLCKELILIVTPTDYLPHLMVINFNIIEWITNTFLYLRGNTNLVQELLLIYWYSIFQIRIIWLLNSLYVDMKLLIFDVCIRCVSILIYLWHCSVLFLCSWAYVLHGWKNTTKIKWQ